MAAKAAADAAYRAFRDALHGACHIQALQCGRSNSEIEGKQMTKQRMFGHVAALIAAAALSGTAFGADSNTKTAVGGGLGGAGGAAAGQVIGGKMGGVAGGAIGGAVGAATTTTGEGRSGAILGGAVGGGAGAAVGQSVGGKTGSIVGAGVAGAAGAAIGRDMAGGNAKPQPRTQVVHTTNVVHVYEDDHGKRKKHKHHPGKGWAKGHDR
jgi:hypothetical protein